MNNPTRTLATVFAASALALVGACSSSPSSRSVAGGPVYSNSPSAAVPVNGQYGRVTGIDVVPVASRTSGGGAVIGAVLGAVIGNQIGSGSGRAVATGVGAVGGGVIGNQIEKRRKNDDEIYRVSVRYDNGLFAQYDYERIDNLRVGDRVMYDNGNLRIAY
jgi:outer membrane lipoprotein SlyB